MNIQKFNKGLYVAAKFMDETVDQILELQKRLKLVNPVQSADLHCTIVYSRVDVPYKLNTSAGFIGQAKCLEVWDTKQGKTLVLLLDSPYLKFRHEYANKLGASYDFDNYIPHITLSYDIGAQLIDTNQDVNIQIELAHEYAEELDLDR